MRYRAFQRCGRQTSHGTRIQHSGEGVNLSGGQKQRLALARGILAARTSDIVLLDEPTSSIDPKTESMIYDKMFVEFSDKAVISTLHRLHLLAKFDYVYLLRDGYVVDEGTFAHLRQNSSAFMELWQHQVALISRMTTNYLLTGTFFVTNTGQSQTP